MNRFAQPQTSARALAGVRLLLAASLLVLLSALAFAIAQESAGAAQPKRKQTLLPAVEKPNIVVIQTDDQTIDQLYATYTPPGGGPIPAMPNTLASIAGKGMTFNR